MQAIVAKWHMDANGNSKILVHCQVKRKGFYTSLLQQELLLKGIDRERENFLKLAAEKLADELEWRGPKYGRMVMGWLPDGSAVFVFTGDGK